MAWDLKFDPVTRDLIDLPNGSPAITETAETMMMHQVLLHYGECWHDPAVGSKFHDLAAFQANPTLLAQAEAERCFGVLVSRGRITNLEIAVSAPSAGRVNIATRSRDANTGQVIDTIARSGG